MAAFPIEGIGKENQESSEDAWTGSIALRWDWTHNVYLYTRYNRAYRSSGTSIVPDPNTQFLPGGILYNGDAETMGVELEGQLLLSETWQVGGALSCNNAEWDGAAWT